MRLRDDIVGLSKEMRAFSRATQQKFFNITCSDLGNQRVTTAATRSVKQTSLFAEGDVEDTNEYAEYRSMCRARTVDRQNECGEPARKPPTRSKESFRPPPKVEYGADVSFYLPATAAVPLRDIKPHRKRSETLSVGRFMQSTESAANRVTTEKGVVWTKMRMQMQAQAEERRGKERERKTREERDRAGIMEKMQKALVKRIVQFKVGRNEIGDVNKYFPKVSLVSIGPLRTKPS